MTGLLLWPAMLVARRPRALSWGLGAALVVGVGTLPWLGVNAWRAALPVLTICRSGRSRAVTAYQTLPDWRATCSPTTPTGTRRR
jgi:hypothetical protein